MTADASFSVQDFLEAITSQLDRTQDSLRMKSVNRPLTYAIRDFSMELKVYVELAADGRVMFRPSASDDSGASVVHIGFTTVNRTMIDENTVSLSSARSPSLEELGLDEKERRQLERLGVRNAAQLDQLKRSTGETAVARYSGLPVSRLRQALAQGRPTVRSVQPVGESGPAGVPHLFAPSATPIDAAPHQDGTVDSSVTVPGAAAAPIRPGGIDAASRVRLPMATRRVVIGGNRIDESATRARLDGRPLELRPVDGGVEVDLGAGATDGTLELDLGHDGIVSMSLEFQPDQPGPPGQSAIDPWRTP